MDINWIGSPHFSNRKGHKIEAIVIHYTGGGSAIGTAKWFRNTHSRVSAHYIISRRGKIIQCVGLDNAAWHAGRSRLPTGSANVNQKTIGIELANRGYLIEDEQSLYYERGGDLRPFLGNASKSNQVLDLYWEIYPREQLEALASLLDHLRYKEGLNKQVLKNIWGHEEIAIPKGRKQDPGPLFPWEWFRR
jgi:N-acetylmuramoyl-L-alanine amidase